MITGLSCIVPSKISEIVPDFIGTNGLNQWDFFVVTMNGNTLSYYKNGVLIGQNSSPSAFSLSTNNPLYIGRDDPGFTDYYTGKIDDIRIYNRVLTYSEVISLYNYQATLNAFERDMKILLDEFSRNHPSTFTEINPMTDSIERQLESFPEASLLTIYANPLLIEYFAENNVQLLY
jgi:hypothetical protein